MTPPPPAEDTSGLELDQQLVVHAYNTATAFVFTTVREQGECVLVWVKGHQLNMYCVGEGSSGLRLTSARVLLGCDLFLL